MLRSVKNGAVICNIGHFDTEIDTQYMRDEWAWEEVKPQVHKFLEILRQEILPIWIVITI